MTTANIAAGEQAESLPAVDECADPIGGLLAMAHELVSDETRAELAKLPADYFEHFRHYAHPLTCEPEPDSKREPPPALR